MIKCGAIVGTREVLVKNALHIVQVETARIARKRNPKREIREFGSKSFTSHVSCA